MRYNKLLPGAIMAALVTSLSGFIHAAPLVSIGDTVDIFFRGSISGQYRSNVFNNSAKNSDYILTVSPGLEANFDRGGPANLSIVFREDFVRYNRFTSQNNNLTNVFVNGSYASGPLTSEAGFSFQQTDTNTTSVLPVVIPQQVRRNMYNAYVKGKYDISPKTYVDGGFNWSRTEYTNNAAFGNRYSNNNTYSFPINGLYRYSEKLDIGLGYRYRYTDNQRVTNSQDHFISLALRGELLPKLNGSLNVGYQIRERSGQPNKESLSINSVFDYLYSPKLTLFAAFDRDFDTSAVGFSTENTGGRIGGRYQITPLISSTASVGYTYTEYLNNPRTDKTTRANLSVTYSPNNYLAFTAGYSYENNNSNAAGASYMGHTVNLTASLRY
jgi:hypothetical protein